MSASSGNGQVRRSLWFSGTLTVPQKVFNWTTLSKHRSTIYHSPNTILKLFLYSIYISILNCYTEWKKYVWALYPFPDDVFRVQAYMDTERTGWGPELSCRVATQPHRFVIQITIPFGIVGFIEIERIGCPPVLGKLRFYYCYFWSSTDTSGA